MAYRRDEVIKQITSPGNSGFEQIALYAGISDGGSTQFQHEAALRFLEIGLSLTEQEDGIALNASQRRFAEDENARHERALGLSPARDRHPSWRQV